MAKYLIILFSLFSLTTSAQQQDLTKFLEAYKTAEFEESQTVIANYSFGEKADYTISEYSKFSVLTFNTDIPNVKGYKAIGNCKVKNKAGGFIDKRMMVVMYFDKTKKHWSVFSLREVAESKNEYEIAKADVEAGKFYTSKEFVYRNLAYWSLMAGQIKDGKKYIELAIEAAKESANSIPFDTSQIDVVIKRIM